jgi:transketolase N-terminal domain/subunit
LSSGLSQDLADLLAIVDSNESVDTAKAKVAALTASIQEKCSAVGVEFAN